MLSRGWCAAASLPNHQLPNGSCETSELDLRTHLFTTHDAHDKVFNVYLEFPESYAFHAKPSRNLIYVYHSCWHEGSATQKRHSKSFLLNSLDLTHFRSFRFVPDTNKMEHSVFQFPSLGRCRALINFILFCLFLQLFKQFISVYTSRQGDPFQTFMWIVLLCVRANLRPRMSAVSLRKKWEESVHIPVQRINDYKWPFVCPDGL